MRTPNNSAGRTTSHRAAASGASIRRSAESRCGCVLAPGIAARKAHRTIPTPLTATKAAVIPTTVAAAPRAGPSSAPKTAEPIAVPISAPRRPGGAEATSQASAPAQEKALPSPCASLAIASTQTLPARPNASVAKAVAATPIKTARLAPNREATRPPGTDAASTPAAYAAVSAPAPPLPSP